MHPNFYICNLGLSSWITALSLGVVVSIALSVYCLPKDFPLNRLEILFVGILLLVFGLAGARVLFLILHSGHGNGFAYFGSLAFAILTLWVYGFFRKANFVKILDYGISFLMLSQVFVRTGCLLGGCCYGKPTNGPFGLVFMTVDRLPRHPTQIYEAILLLAVYITSRYVYERKKRITGYTFFFALGMYAAGRFFIEFLRTDSPVIFLNMITLAQVTCIMLAISALLAIRLYVDRR